MAWCTVPLCLNGSVDHAVVVPVSLIRWARITRPGGVRVGLAQEAAVLLSGGIILPGVFSPFYPFPECGAQLLNPDGFADVVVHPGE